MFKSIFEYRELLKTNVKKDIRGKYKGSFLGILWSFLNPLLQVVVYWIVFPYLFRGAAIPNYLCYLVTGIIPWTFFINTVTMGTVSMKSNANILKKVYFPREILLVSQVLSGIINFLISCVIIIIFCVGTGAGVSWHLVFLPLVIIIQSMLTLGITFILSAVDVYVQDMEYIVQFVLNMAFYATPILYSLDMFGSAGVLLKLIRLNPLTVLINAYREIFLYHHIPGMKGLLMVALLSIIILICGYKIFRKLERNFAEEL